MPLIIKPPAEFGSSIKKFAGQRCEQIVTLAVEYKGEMDRAALLSYHKSAEDRAFFGNCKNRYFAVIDRGWKYLLTNCNGNELMFNLKQDDKELHDLSGEAAHAGRKEELKKLCFGRIRLPRKKTFEGRGEHAQIADVMLFCRRS